jgi:hypothetical protein
MPDQLLKRNQLAYSKELIKGLIIVAPTWKHLSREGKVGMGEDQDVAGAGVKPAPCNDLER